MDVRMVTEVLPDLKDLRRYAKTLTNASAYDPFHRHPKFKNFVVDNLLGTHKDGVNKPPVLLANAQPLFPRKKAEPRN